MPRKAPMTFVHRTAPRVARWCLVICWSLALGHRSFARADSVFVGSLERKNAVIKEIRDDNLIFEISQREAEPVPLARVTKLVVTNEPALNAAEEAFAAGKFDQAVDGYQKTLRSTNKPWLKDWSAMRLIEAANKTGRFDAATTAYIAALMKDP